MKTKERYQFTATWCKKAEIDLTKNYFQLTDKEIGKLIWIADFCRFKTKDNGKSRVRAFYDTIKKYGL